MAKKKGRRGGDRPSPQSSDGRNFSTRSWIKAVIVRMALWGLIPACFATWLIQRGGLKDA